MNKNLKNGNIWNLENILAIYRAINTLDGGLWEKGKSSKLMKFTILNNIT